MNLTLFKVIALLVLLFFAIFISDFRNKKGMIPLISKKIIVIIKLFYCVPICVYVYVLMTINTLLVHDYIGLILTSVGTILVAKAKIDIGGYHTWAGHKLHSTKMITKGIYGFIRHPIYTGIFIFIFGALFANINKGPLYLAIMVIIILIFNMTFLAMMAQKETKFLHKEFGDEFLKYQQQVHPFLPLRKYKCGESIVARSPN